MKMMKVFLLFTLTLTLPQCSWFQGEPESHTSKYPADWEDIKVPAPKNRRDPASVRKPTNKPDKKAVERAKKELDAKIKKIFKKAKEKGHDHLSLEMLDWDEINRISYNQLVRYVKLVQRTYRDMAKMERMLGQQVALNTLPEKDSKLYALLMGPKAYAQASAQDLSNYIETPGQKQSRGMDSQYRPTDRGIYALQLTQYASGRGEGGLVPETCTTTSGNSGVVCGFNATGLSGYSDHNCMENSKVSNYGYSAACRKRQQQLEQDNKSVINDRLAKWEEFLDSKEDSGASLKDLNDSAKHLGLDKYAYDPRVYAHLLKLAAKNRVNGEELPDFLSDFSNYTNRPDHREDLEGAVTEQEYIEYHLYELLAHCNREVSEAGYQEMKKALRKYKEGSARWKLAKRRKEAWESGKKKVKDSLQMDECENIENYVKNELQPAYRGIKTTLPDITDGDTGSLISGRTPDNEEETEDIVTKSFGDVCSRYRAGDSRDHRIINKASICAACTAEVHRSKSDGPEDANAYAKTSSKWMTLLQIMSRKCGGFGDDLWNVDYALKAMKTYGHCSEDLYGWKNSDFSDSGITRKAREDLIRSWQNGQQMGELNTHHFKAIFGHDVDVMARVMCGETEAETNAEHKNLLEPDATTEVMGNRRLRANVRFGAEFSGAFKSQVGRDYTAQDWPPDPYTDEYELSGFQRCFISAQKFAKENYSRSSGKTCQSMHPAASLNAGGIMDENWKPESPMIATNRNKTDCYVAEGYTQKDGDTLINFADAYQDSSQNIFSVNKGVMLGDSGLNISDISVTDAKSCPGPHEHTDSYDRQRGIKTRRTRGGR